MATVGPLTGRIGAATPPPVSSVDFSAQIRPILSAKCYPCHGPDETGRKAKLRLDSFADATALHKGHQPISPKNPGASEILRRISSTDKDEIMPPPEAKNPVKPEELELLRQWIAQGAEYTPHWAWTKPVRPKPPAISNRGWPRNGLDYFVLSKLEQNGLTPAPEADRYTLVRRVSLDLTGLPPTPELVEDFVNDRDPKAYEKLVDTLLSSPHFGERWARLWLDLGRYADSAGYGSDPLRQNIWPWRDWLIQALNKNQPFDEFTRDLLAGDLVPNHTRDQEVATAFHRNTMTNTEGGTDDEEYRVAAVKDRANVTGQVWMGLTIGCAQCHSHKFDPITQREYYSFYGLFNQTEDNDQPDERPTLPLRSPEEEREYSRLHQIAASLESFLRNPDPELRKELDTVAGPHPYVIELEKTRRQLDQIRPVAVPVMRELASDRQRTNRILIKGNFLDPGAEVSPGVPASFHSWPKDATSNRLGLAAWIMSPENPLTARVAVNRYWAQLMGRAIVETEEDFGTQGSLPTNRELLDWLAVSFQSRTGSDAAGPALGWNFKEFVKLVVTSATYRQSSVTTPEKLQKDPLNKLYAHAPRVRLDAETIRDQALALSGLLSGKIGGPSVYPLQPDGLWRAAFNGERSWTTSPGEDRYRRGLYTFWRRTVPYPSMTAFDAPSRESCTVRRLPSNTPLQSLVTLNDPVFVEAAQSLGRRISKFPGSPTERIVQAIQLVQVRPPMPGQVEALARLFETELSNYKGHPEDATRLASEPLGPIPPDLTAPEAAAWTSVGNILLNMDSIMTKG
jgi:hypothetical protein